MKKILLIIQREYMIRVKKKSFIIMTILGPILMAAIFIAPVFFGMMKDNDVRHIAVIDDSGIYDSTFTDSERYTYDFLQMEVDTAKQYVLENKYYALLHIPATKVVLPESAMLYSSKQATLDVKEHIRGMMKRRIEGLKLQASGIDRKVLATTKAKITLSTIKMTDSGEEEKSFAEVAMGIGIGAGLIIYMFIFIFGAQVMRGVMEEKTNRIVEVIVSSVKPFQLMMGKILGLAAVGLTQILLWVVLTSAIYAGFTTYFADTINFQEQQEMMLKNQALAPQMGLQQEQIVPENVNEQAGKVFEIVNSINFPGIIASFIFFFLGGYLLYSALFAAVGAAVDNEADTQQFMLPITVPLILSIVSAQFVVQNPEGPLSFWLSIIPLSSPIIMMIRIPFGVPFTELALSMGLLIVGFIATTWLAAKIYRTGILMYGKKITYKELWKWIRYKN